MMSVKFQMTLPDELAQELKSTANSLNIPLAQFIRETMEDRLRNLPKDATDPFAWMDGILENEEPDLSTRVDEILYAPHVDPHS